VKIGNQLSIVTMERETYVRHTIGFSSLVIHSLMIKSSPLQTRVRKLSRGLAIAGCLLAVTAAQAVPIVFTGSSGVLSASASFDIVGGNLQVTLTNTSTADTLVPSDVLTAVFFNVAGNPSLTPLSGTLAGTTLYGATGPNVGGEWAYNNGLNQFGANSGISSAGFGLFGPPDLFPGPNLDGPDSPNGLNYGIVSAGDNAATGNAGVTGVPLLKGSVVFTLSGITSVAGISNITFQYGTSLGGVPGGEPSFPGSPGPGGPGVPDGGSTVILCGAALALLGVLRRFRRA
jgi:hypothetical protein